MKVCILVAFMVGFQPHRYVFNMKCILLITIAALLASCSTCPLGICKSRTGSIQHIVLAWLKKPLESPASTV